MVKSLITRIGWLAGIIFFLASAFAYGQLTTTATHLDPVIRENENRQLLAAGTDGVFVYSTYMQERQLMMEFTVLDTALSQKLIGGVNFGDDKSIVMSKYAEGRAWFLTRPLAKSGDFGIYGVFLDSAIYTFTRFTNAIPFQPLFFEVSKDAAVVAGYFNSRPIALFCDFRSGESKLLPGFFNQAGEINQVLPAYNGGFDILLSLRTSGYRKSAFLNRYSASGELIKSSVVDSGKERSLIFARYVRTGKDSSIIAGIYGNRSEYARGIFVAALNPDDNYTIRFYNFGDLKNFFRHLRPGRQERIQDRIERRKIKSRPLRFPHRILVHELRSKGDEFVMLAESFYPTYRSGYSGSIRPGSTGIFTFIRPFYPYQRDLAFDGFRYTHGIALGIDRSGSITWDNSLALKNIRTFNLQQFTQLQPGIENDYLLYAVEDDFTGKAFRQSETIGPAGKEFKARLWESRVPAPEPYRCRITQWYSNTMLQSGYKEIATELAPGTTVNRLVFYIGKVTAR